MNMSAVGENKLWYLWFKGEVHIEELPYYDVMVVLAPNEDEARGEAHARSLEATGFGPYADRWLSESLVSCEEINVAGEQCVLYAF